jgi:3-amino-5-hydroxybenzoate synthase
MSLPGLLGGTPVADADTYPSWPQWDEREREELLATLDSGAWWTGDGVRALRDFARYQGAMGYPFTNGTQTLEVEKLPIGAGA